MVGRVAQKGLKPKQQLTKRTIMTTDTQVILPKKISPENSRHSIESIESGSSKLEERKGNSLKPLSLRPGRSLKKNTSLKPLGFKSK